MIFRFSFPVVTKSPNGARRHPQVMARLLRETRQAVFAMATIDLRGQMSEHMPRIVVVYTRRSPKLMDTDNLGTALKPVRDAVCQALGLSDDNSVLVAHRYEQAKADPLQPQVDVDVEVSCVTCNVGGRFGPSTDLAELVMKLDAAKQALALLLAPGEKA